ncbi:hypothetical protein [Actinoplanes sp. NPDC051851]|uniref:hypothetical protein n=1 Tax=Actinoplanes sp. NPDC051851 TaxID=3154753 RepID=UPI00343CC75E
MTTELAALKALRFDHVVTEDDVWNNDLSCHVDGLHPGVETAVQENLDALRADGQHSSTGIVVEGELGVGKTQMLKWTQIQTQRRGGYFFLLYAIERGVPFHTQLLRSLRLDLEETRSGQRAQASRFVDDLAKRLEVAPLTGVGNGSRSLPRVAVEAIVSALPEHDTRLGSEYQDTLRALILLASPAPNDRKVGSVYLQGGEINESARRRWGFQIPVKSPSVLISEITRLLALSGPVVVAVDQIDALVKTMSSSPQAANVREQVIDLGHGLMDLHSRSRRTLIIVSCLPDSWEALVGTMVNSFADRFWRTQQLRNIPDPEIAERLVARRFAIDYRRVGFRPDYGTWPVHPSAFRTSTDYTARRLIDRIRHHVKGCLNSGIPSELFDFAEERRSGQSPSALQTEFEKLAAAADVETILGTRSEDRVMPLLLGAALDAWIREHPTRADRFVRLEVKPERPAAVHALLTSKSNTSAWHFRVVTSVSPQPTTVRIKAAMEGFDGSADSRLYLIKAKPWPTGSPVGSARRALRDAGGIEVDLDDADVRTFEALRQLMNRRPDGLEEWLRSHQPAGKTKLLRQIFTDV